MSDITRSEAIDVIESIMRKYEEDECVCCDIMLGDEEYEALRLARDSLKADETYQLEYEKPEICEDAVNRQEVIKLLRMRNGNEYIVKMIKQLPSVLPKVDKSIIYCRDCKWWKESDGTYRRGVRAESKCHMNTKVIYEGNGYCYLAEPKMESEDNNTSCQG